MTEQCVRLHVPLHAGLFHSLEERELLYRLEQIAEEAVVTAGVGALLGEEMGEGYAEVSLTGPDANQLCVALAAALSYFPFPQGSCMLLRFGPPGAREERLWLN